jgi:TfoX/Sxy family transcriptional regulator of competence genes
MRKRPGLDGASVGNLEIIEDACAALRHTTRAMFGGHGLFAPNGGMFAGIVTDDEIVLKLEDETMRAELVALGGHPWVYDGKMTMKAWIVIPDRFYDEPNTLSEWAARAWRMAPPKRAKGDAAKGRAAKRAKGGAAKRAKGGAAKRAK